MKLNIIKINGHKLALISAICMGILMILFLPIFLIVSSNTKEMNHGFKLLFIFSPLIYFVLGYVSTRIFVGLFNIVVKWLNGFEIEVSNEIIEKGKE
jgi:hypothetical protein